MGAGNVSAVYAYWSRLNHVPFRLLTYMALVCLDRDDAPRFWGGRDALACAIGRQVPPEPPRADQSPAAAAVRAHRRAAHEAVRAALHELKRAGVLSKVDGTGHIGQQAEYLLHLTAKVQAQPVPLPSAPGGAKTQAQPVPETQPQPPRDAGSACRETQAEPARDTGSACEETQAQPVPKEDSGGEGTPKGGDGLETSPVVGAASLDDDPLAARLPLDLPDSPPTPAAQAAETEADMLHDPEDPRPAPGCYGREDWIPTVAAEAVRRVVETSVLTEAAAVALLQALATDPKVLSPVFLTTSAGLKRAKSLLHAQTRDPEVTETAAQRTSGHREAVAAAADATAKRAAAQDYLDGLDEHDRAVVLHDVECRVRAARNLGDGPIQPTALRQLLLGGVAERLLAAPPTAEVAA